MDNEKILDIAIILVVFLIACGLIWFFFEDKEMLNDYRCTNLPINEFFQVKNVKSIGGIKNDRR